MPTKQTAPEPERDATFAERLAMDTPDVHVDARDSRMFTQIVIDKVKEVVGPGVRVHLALGLNSLKPQRLADLGRFGYMPLRWSHLKPKQQRELRAVLPFRADDMCCYGDLVVCVATEENAKRREQYKNELRLNRQRAMADRESAATQSRELGIQVEDKW